MIKRKIDDYFDSFFKNHREALLISGARQIGKTYSIRQWGKEHYKYFVEINFLEQPEAVHFFDDSYNAKELLLRLSSYANVPFEKGKTLFFFDEVQECKNIVTAIKFLVDEGSYRYILSGSLLGVELFDVRSVPVGYMVEKQMFPLDLEEFVCAVGIRNDIITHLQECFEQRKQVDAVIHDRMLQLFRLYLLVGGMPAVVQNYIDNNNMQYVVNIQRNILQQYKKDIAKYDTEHKLNINEIFALIPPELNAKNKRFILKNLNENVKYSRYEDRFLWLKNAGVALPTYNVEEPVAPLLLSRSRNLFKLFQNDVGLLAAQYANDIQIRVLSGETNINYGAIYENVVAQELTAHQYPLYYFNSKKQGEVDFLLERDNEIIPLEVKSGKDYERHNALSNLLRQSEYHIEKAYVLCNENISVKEKVIYLPIYMTMFLQHDSPSHNLIYKVDLTGLTS